MNTTEQTGVSSQHPDNCGSAWRYENPRLFVDGALSCEETRPASLHSVDLSLSPWLAPELLGQLIAIKVLAFWRLNWSKRLAGFASNGTPYGWI
jgi:hypothetical protein